LSDSEHRVRERQRTLTRRGGAEIEGGAGRRRKCRQGHGLFWGRSPSPSETRASGL
jgi:hypothetical protein